MGTEFIKIHSLEHALDRLEQRQREQLNILEMAGNVLAAAVPSLTKGQAAYLLSGSSEHINKLERAGKLQVCRSGNAKYDTAQVWRLFLAGETGHARSKTFNLQELLNSLNKKPAL